MESGPMLMEQSSFGSCGTTRDDTLLKDYSKLPIKKRKFRSSAASRAISEGSADLRAFEIKPSTPSRSGQSTPGNNRTTSMTSGHKRQRTNSNSRANNLPLTSKKVTSTLEVRSPTTPEFVPSALDQGGDDALACLVAVASACADQAQVVADSVAVQQVRDSCIDSNGEGPSVSVKEVLNASSFLLLPVEYQQRLLTLLPEVDCVQQENHCRPSEVAFSNKFFTRACEQWKEQLKNGTLWHGADLTESTEVPQRCLRATKSRCASRLHQQLSSLPASVQEIVQDLPSPPTSTPKKNSRRILLFGDDNQKTTKGLESGMENVSLVKEPLTNSEGDIHPFEYLLQALEAVSPPPAPPTLKRQHSQSFSAKNRDNDGTPARKRRSFATAGKKSTSAKAVVVKDVGKTAGSKESRKTAGKEPAKPTTAAKEAEKCTPKEQGRSELGKVPTKEAGKITAATKESGKVSSSASKESVKAAVVKASLKAQPKETGKMSQSKEGGKPSPMKQSSGKPPVTAARNKGPGVSKKVKAPASSKCMLSRVPFHARVGHLRSRFSTMPPFTMYEMPEEDIGDMCQVMSSGFDHDYARGVPSCSFSLVPAISCDWRLDHNYSKPPSALPGSGGLTASPARLCPASARLTSIVPSAGISWLSPPRILPSDLGTSQPTFEPMDPADLASVPEVGIGVVQPQTQAGGQTKNEVMTVAPREDSAQVAAGSSNNQVTLLSLPPATLGQLMAVAQSSLRSNSVKSLPGQQQEGGVQKGWPLILQPVSSPSEKLSLASNGFITQSLLLLDPAAGQQMPSTASKTSMPQAVSVNLA